MTSFSPQILSESIPTFPLVTSLSQSREIFPIAVNGIEQRSRKWTDRAN